LMEKSEIGVAFSWESASSSIMSSSI